jgi:hypothetical protein
MAGGDIAAQDVSVGARRPWDGRLSGGVLDLASDIIDDRSALAFGSGPEFGAR